MWEKVGTVKDDVQAWREVAVKRSPDLSCGQEGQNDRFEFELHRMSGSERSWDGRPKEQVE